MRLLPVVLRPEPGEVLSSWVCRIAAIYGVEVAEILGPGIRYEHLAVSPEESALNAICIATRIPARFARLHTFRGYYWRWPDHWATRRILRSRCFGKSYHEETPLMQVCVRCLQEDRQHGVQFLRLRWLSAAATFCQRHREPLVECCTLCARVCMPACRRIAGLFYFVCDACDGVQEEYRGKKLRRCDESGVEWLLRFERTLSQALDGGQVDPLWAGPSTPKQFVRLVEDLVWALTRPAKINSQQSPIAWFAVNRFPHGRYRLGPTADHCLSITTVQWRRTLLAAVSCLLAGPELRRVMDNDPWTQIRGTSLADLTECLAEPFSEELRIRSLHWPPNPRAMLGERFGISPLI
jgi:hypothetical protein